MTMELGSRVGTAPNVSAVSHDEGIVFLHARSCRLFEANQVGARIWETLQRHATPQEITAEISHAYGLPAATVAEDVHKFLGELAQHHLIEWRVER